MASQYYVTMRLEPHYQRFLRSQFMCDSEIFEFPVRHYFNTVLEHFVVTKRNGSKELLTDENSFKIRLPNFELKNPAFFHYLTEVKEGVFRAKIKDYYDWIIQDRIGTLMSQKEKLEDGHVIMLDRQQCTLVLIDEFGFDLDDRDSFDRLYKMYSRFKHKERNRRFVIKSRKKSEK
jgi:hypothetical protein